MRRELKYIGTLMLVATLLGACTGLPGATEPVPTQEATILPASTLAPGSTEVAPVADVSESTSAPEPTEPATPAPAAASPETVPAELPTATVSGSEATAVPVATVAPAPTMAAAPTEAATAAAEPSIACTPGALTPAQTEGPYYTANPPETSTLFQPGMAGEKLTLSGYVLNQDCEPVPGARVDFWQADAAGQYDNQGYSLRGYQLTDSEGRYSLETVLPGLYPGRTRHIHVKVTPPGGQTLTSQLYFTEEAANTSDRIFSPELLVIMEEAADGKSGTFNFVIRAQ